MGWRHTPTRRYPDELGRQLARRVLWRSDPATYDCLFTGDEAFHVLEGAASIELLDTEEKIELPAGNIAYFSAGTRSIWTVTQPFKKFTFMRQDATSRRRSLACYFFEHLIDTLSDQGFNGGSPGSKGVCRTDTNHRSRPFQYDNSIAWLLVTCQLSMPFTR